MGSNFLSPPAKRAIQYTTITGMPDLNLHTVNGPSTKRSKGPAPPLPIPPGHVSFRLLCHVSRIGGVIGKAGNVIKQLQQQTGAKIRIEEAPAECPDRVITVVAPAAIDSKFSFSSNNKSGDGDSVKEEIDVSKGQEALLRVFERILEVAAETDGVGVAPGGVVSCRMLAEAKQAGSVIGKGGKVVEKIRKDCGCKIRILIENLPACAGSTEEIVEIEGDVLAVKKALAAVSRCLQDCQPVDKTRMTVSKPVEAAPRERLPDISLDILPQHNSVLPTVSSTSFKYAPGTHPLSSQPDRVPTVERKKLQHEVVFRILCSNDRVGAIIGKGGNIVKALHHETGASINIGAAISECDERLITITASENPESRYSAAQKTVVLVFLRSVDTGMEKGLDSSSSKAPPASARLVVSSNQVGCLLGKGGAIISEMRKVTSTGIRIIGFDHVPKCVQQNDHVVQITGDLMNVKDAIFHVTGRLRDNLFSSMLGNSGAKSMSFVLSETISPYVRLGDALPDHLRENLRDPLTDALRDPLREPLRDMFREPVRDPVPLTLHSSVGVSHSLSRHNVLAQSMDHLGLSHGLDRPPSPRAWASRTITGVNPRGMDVSRGLASFKGGIELGSGSKSAIVTNTTVEIVVPENVISSVYGENGSNLARLRQISGAKVIVHEPRLGSSDRIIVISGTPDETQAAQSLLQAFILTGQS